MARGEHEPKDSRNVTGTASTNRDGTPPVANGEHPRIPAGEHEYGEDDGELVDFEPDPELARKIAEGQARRLEDAAQTRH